MEKQLFKVLGKEITEILAVNKLTKYAVLRADNKDVKAFVLVKMFFPTKPDLNNDGVDVSDKEWKKSFPIVLKASTDGEYIFSLYDLLNIIGGSSDSLE